MTGVSPAVLFGLRCGNPHHPKSGEVYGINPEWQHLARLTNDGCSELVVSSDGGVTWRPWSGFDQGASLTSKWCLGVEQCPAPEEGSATSALYLTDHRDTLKMLRETLCIAQTALGQMPYPVHPGHGERIGRIILEIDRQRPLGPDGKHGDRHTPTCGCEAGQP